ncbi:SDR family oxidoreductase [Bythopirellula goksoeyrii]|uniref:Enoyl-[acyl-carrier-protein] reductase [NADPH] FabL n=1 Tax=Bythopirellula goksoeyrii TaxID=1400387 RepID=A0A5B9QGP7_9BACT|nr:SDR family oxidoreductase [Bythopirellula goksoeyrii]QEG36762.1 Enoyl-[acyl-carrier-protein] reductase [NADPH] FabL [Bythopirellula goksoeyrii]
MRYQVKDCVALVTGANRGIGKAITEGLLARGAAKVYAAVRKLSSVEELIDQYGDRIVPIEIDLEKPATIESAAKTAEDVTLVVNNAGVLRTESPLSQEAVDALNFEMNVNVYGLMRMAQAFAPVLKKNGGGGFVQLNSVASLKSFPDFATYSASKAAAYSITQALKVMLSDEGIQVVSVHPGPIATDMGSQAGLDEVAEPPALVADAIVDALATGKFHAFPDSTAKQIGAAYESFAKSVIEAEMDEG